MNDEARNALLSRLRPHLPVVVGLLAGALVGAVVMAVFGGGTSDDHARHAAGEGTREQMGQQAGEHAGHQTQTWTCSMHPQIKKSESGKCPICGMDLIPVASDDSAGAYEGPGVSLSKRARALAELRTVPVRRQADAAAEVRLLGRIEPDETHLKVVTAWTGGRID